MNLKVKRLGRSPDLNIKSLCKINTEFEYKNTPINIYTNLIKENIKVSFSLICNIGHYIPPVEPIKLDYPGIINIFSNHESIFISWSKIENAVYYELVLNGVTIITEYNNYTFTGLQENTEYTIYLRSKSGSFYYTDSDYTSITVFTTEYSNTPIQLQSPKLNNIKTTPNSIYIEWNKVFGAIGYELALNGKDFIRLDYTNYEFNNLVPDTTYTIILRSIGDNYYYQNSEYRIEYITTDPPPTALNSPEIILYSTTQSSIFIKWKVVEKAVAYKVSIYSKNLDYSKVYYTKDNVYLFEKLFPANIYIVSITAIADYIYNLDSEESIVELVTNYPETLKFSNSNFTIIEVDLNTIYLEWDKVENAKEYEFIINYDYNNVITTSSNNYTFTDLEEGTNYIIYAKAIGDNLYYYNSSPVKLNLTTLSSVILDPPIVNFNVDNNNLYLMWEKVLNAFRYEITLNDNIVYTEELNYIFEGLEYGDYNLSIKSIGDGKYYLDSEYTNIHINIEKPDDPEDPEDPEELPRQLKYPIIEIIENKPFEATIGWTVDDKALKYILKLTKVMTPIVIELSIEELVYYEEGKAKYTFTNLVPGDYYRVEVQAIGDQENYFDSKIGWNWITNKKYTLPKITDIRWQLFKNNYGDYDIEITWDAVEGGLIYYYEFYPVDNIYKLGTATSELEGLRVRKKVDPCTIYCFEIEVHGENYNNSETSYFFIELDKLEGYAVRITEKEITPKACSIQVKFKPNRFATKYIWHLKNRFLDYKQDIEVSQDENAEYLYVKFENLEENTKYSIGVTTKGDGTEYFKDSSVYFADVTTLSRIPLYPPKIKEITSTDNQIYISWDSAENAYSYFVELYKENTIIESKDIYVEECYFYNLEEDTEYTIKIKTVGESNDYIDSSYITQTIKTKIKEDPIPPEPEEPEEPDIPIPPEPEDPYLKVFPEEYYQNVSGNLFKFLVKTNTNWKLSYDSTPYLVVLPREKVWASSLSHTLFYRVKTNIYWNINRKLESGYIKVNPLDVMVTPEQHNIKYNVESSIPWYVSYQLKELWDNVKSSDGEILLDKNGEELLVKIT